MRKALVVGSGLVIVASGIWMLNLVSNSQGEAGRSLASTGAGAAGRLRVSGPSSPSVLTASFGVKAPRTGRNSLMGANQTGPLRDRFLTGQERESVRELTQIMATGAQGSQSPQEFLAKLVKARLRPKVSRDFNAETGKLAIIRTENTLPGTRYLHAQVFEGETEGSGRAQHISFELRPGKDSMDVAIAMVRESHPNLGLPEIQTADFVLWRSDGRAVSVKKLNAEDLKHNYFNAHAPDDVGTVWVSSEDEPAHG